LQSASKQLEYCLARLKYGVEMALERHGRDISNEQMVLQRLANVAIDIYGMSAVLSRASRSYCIGLRNADHEVCNTNEIILEWHGIFRYKYCILFALRLVFKPN
jgi:acyl-CoA dehydrogenase family protein 9